MKRPTKVIVDCSTGEQSIIELTDQEIADMQAAAAEFEKNQKAAEAEAAAKAAARLEILAKLGLTEEEARALLG